MDYQFTYQDTFKVLDDWAKKELSLLSIEVTNDKDIPYFIQYQNYISKKIEVKPRKVSHSKKLIIPESHKNGFDKLIRSIKHGADINPYLSKQSNNASNSDGLLDSFGVKHLHLGSDIQNGFIERTGPIALVFIDDSEVFFIKIVNHGRGNGLIWYDPEILEIIHEERPNFIIKSKVTMMKISNPLKTAQDIRGFRRVQLNGTIELKDGTQYSTSNGFGQSAANFQISHTSKMIDLIKAIMREIRLQQIACESNYVMKISNIKPIILEYNKNYIHVEMQITFINNIKASLYFKLQATQKNQKN